LYKGRVGLDNDVVFTAPVDNISSRQPGMDLPLAHRNFAPTAVLNILVKLLKMVYTVVRDTNRTDFA
jgi:hypothetical protein